MTTSPAGTNPLRTLLAAGAAAVGSWCGTPSSFTAELLTAEPVDYVCFDCQHGLVDVATLGPLLAAVKPTPAVVRVPANDPALIGKALDLGAAAIIVPLVNSADEAARAVAACRYPPHGVRSYGPTRISLTVGADPADLDAHPLCFVMVETPAAVAAVEAICAVDGLAGIYIGPADLAIGLGLRPADAGGPPGAGGWSAHDAAVAAVREACERAGIVPGIHTTGGEDARNRLAAGFRMCSLPSDAILLRAALRRELTAARPAR